MTSKIQHKILSTIVFLLLWIAAFQSVSADTLSLPIGQVTVIRSGEVNRVRIGFDISALENTRVD